MEVRDTEGIYRGVFPQHREGTKGHGTFIAVKAAYYLFVSKLSSFNNHFYRLFKNNTPGKRGARFIQIGPGLGGVPSCSSTR